jgi:hypothetical protein
MKLIGWGAAAREMLQRKRLESKVDDSRIENARLRVENRALREEGRHERGQMQQLLASLERIGDGRRRGRARGIVAIAMAAGGAYVLGARAGRDRYEQIARRWERWRTRGRRSINGAMRELEEVRGRVDSSEPTEVSTVPTTGMNAHAVGPA